MKAMRSILFAISISLSSLVLARPVSTEEASYAAAMWLECDGEETVGYVPGTAAVDSVFSVGFDGRILYHVVSLVGGGYVAMAADTGVSPVLFVDLECDFDQSPEGETRQALDAEAEVSLDEAEAAREAIVAGIIATDGSLDANEADWETLLSGFVGVGRMKVAAVSAKGRVSLSAALDNSSLSFTTGGYQSWFGTTAYNSDGVDCAQVGPLGNTGCDRASWLRTTIIGPGELSYFCRIKDGAGIVGEGMLELQCDGVTIDSIDGGQSTWTKRTVVIPSGRHSVQWRFLGRPGPFDRPSGVFAHVDKVVFTPRKNVALATALDCSSVAFTTGGYSKWFGQRHFNSDGVDCAQGGYVPNGKVSWLRGKFSGAGTLVFSYKGDVEVDVDGYCGYRNIEGLYLYDPLPFTVLSESSTGWRRVALRIGACGAHTVTWRVRDGAIGRVDKVAWTKWGPQNTLAKAVNCPFLCFTTGGHAKWFVQTSFSEDGVSCARSGQIGLNQVSWIKTTIDGPCSVSWDSTVSGTRYDSLEIWIDGKQEYWYSGLMNYAWWDETPYLGPGKHTIVWRFKRSDVKFRNGGVYRAWLDNVFFLRY